MSAESKFQEMFEEPDSPIGLMFKNGFLEAFSETYRTLRDSAGEEERFAYSLGKIAGAKAAVEALSERKEKG